MIIFASKIEFGSSGTSDIKLLTKRCPKPNAIGQKSKMMSTESLIVE